MTRRRRRPLLTALSVPVAVVVIGGCAGAPDARPASSAPAASASLRGSCVVGYEWTPASTNAADGVFVPGPPPAGNSSGDPALA